MKHPWLERRLSSIALDVGFPALAEFSRAFRRLYGLPPSKWDRCSRLDSRRICPGRATPVDPRTGEPRARIVRHDRCRLAYVRMRTYFQPDILRVGYDRLTRWLEGRGIAWQGEQLVGMSWDHFETTPLDQVHYDLAFTVPAEVAGDEEIGIYELSAIRAVEVHCRGELRAIAEAWDYLYQDWFPGSRFEPANLPAMKWFRKRPDEIGWDSWDLDCSIALEPAMP